MKETLDWCNREDYFKRDKCNKIVNYIIEVFITKVCYVFEHILNKCIKYENY